MCDAKRRQTKIIPAQQYPGFQRPPGIKDIEICFEEDSRHDQTGDCAEALDVHCTGSFVKTTRSKSPNVVNRLYEWGRDKETRLKEIRDNYINNYSFTPRINEVSKMLIELEDANNPTSKNFKFDMTKG